jgi:hypothetical protein
MTAKNVLRSLRSVSIWSIMRVGKRAASVKVCYLKVVDMLKVNKGVWGNELVIVIWYLCKVRTYIYS